MTTPLSGHCGIGHPVWSHEKCTLEGCPCIHHRMPAPAPVAALQYDDALHMTATAVAALERDLPDWIDGCTDPEGTDLAELFVTILELRKRLQTVERDVELATAKAMMADEAETPTLRVERRRGAERKAWQHDDWQRDVRAKALQSLGLKGAQGVLTADGEVLPAEVLHQAIALVESAHSAAAPKTGTLKALGLDARDYCESSPGAWAVRVTRMADETKAEVA